MAEADQLGPLPSGLSRVWSWPPVATVTSGIVDVLEFGKPPLRCVPSTKVYVKRFSMPAGALVAAPVGARFHPALARCQRLDSHCLRAHCTIKHPRVSTDHLVRQTMLQRHDDSPPGKPDAGHQARPDCGVPSVSNCSSAIFRDLSFACLIHMNRTLQRKNRPVSRALRSRTP